MSRKFYRGVAGLAVLIGCEGLAQASFLDTDFWCRTYGCAVVHDGQNFDIYDNFIFAQNTCCIAVGTPMIPFSRRFGDFNLTGSLDTPQGPGATQSMMIGIAQNGTSVTQAVIDDGDGYLDAGDSFSTAFAINANTALRLDGQGQQYSHSFFVTSRNTRFSLRALASISNSSLDFTNTLSLDDIQIEPRITRTGNDGGFGFGSDANANNIAIAPGVNDLGDLAALPTNLVQFNRNAGIRRRNGDINDQTIRLDFIYTMPQYDMSMGIGSFNIDVVFDFYREP